MHSVKYVFTMNNLCLWIIKPQLPISTTFVQINQIVITTQKTFRQALNKNVSDESENTAAHTNVTATANF